MTKIEILEYIRTIFIALLVALILAGIATGCSKIIAEQHARMIAKISNTTKDNELIGFLITKYAQEAAKNPGDYELNVKLGNLYELMFSYKQAEEQYKRAINKSPFGVYSSYLGLANLYIKTGKLEEALNIVKKLKNTDHKPLLVAKGDFYMNLGDALWEKGDYKNAVNQYKIAFFFYKKVSSSKKDTAVEGILDCYNKLADIDFKHDNIYGAIESLETSLLYKETPFLFYKLAILYKDVDAMQANVYMEKTFKTDPGIINFDIYEEILLNLISYYYESGKEVEMELYKQKLKVMKNFQKRYVITENDVKVEIVSIKFKENLFKTKKNLKVKFKITNNSKYDFNSLFVIVKIRSEEKTKEIFNHRFYSKKKPLKSRSESQEYKINYTIGNDDEMFVSEKLWLDFYAGKKDNMRKLPVHSVELLK